MFARTILPYLTPLSSVRRNLLIVSAIALLVSFFTVDVSGFEFLGITFEPQALNVSILAVLVFYIFGYTIKVLGVILVVDNEYKQSKSDIYKKIEELIPQEPISIDKYGNYIHNKNRNIDLKNITQLLKTESIIGVVLAYTEFGAPLILGIVGFFGMLYNIFR